MNHSPKTHKNWVDFSRYLKCSPESLQFTMSFLAYPFTYMSLSRKLGSWMGYIEDWIWGNMSKIQELLKWFLIGLSCERVKFKEHCVGSSNAKCTEGIKRNQMVRSPNFKSTNGLSRKHSFKFNGKRSSCLFHPASLSPHGNDFSICHNLKHECKHHSISILVKTILKLI